MPGVTSISQSTWQEAELARKFPRQCQCQRCATSDKCLQLKVYADKVEVDHWLRAAAFGDPGVDHIFVKMEPSATSS
ncbi:hypothetical protein VAR608DRAFT_1327 [Variovorax sp. HW608]|nr:hypothetical protein VAR608DRAFT_1327 [Variovorax sp. HW608]